MGGRSSVEVVVLEGLAALAEGGVLPLVRPQQRLVRVPSPASCRQTQVFFYNVLKSDEQKQINHIKSYVN